MLSEKELREMAREVVSRIDDTGALPWPESEELVEEALRSVQDDALEAAAGACYHFETAHSDHCNTLCHLGDYNAINALRRKP